MHDRKLELQKRSAILGALVGDALGVPYEFQDKATFPSIPETGLEMTPPLEFESTHPVPPGTWSDDGAQILCLQASLSRLGYFDEEDFAKRLLAWRKFGYMTPDGQVFDIGQTTNSALTNMQAHFDTGKPTSVLKCGLDSGANGALMRTLPIALSHTYTLIIPHVALSESRKQAGMTHASLESLIAIDFYTQWVMNMAHHKSTSFMFAVEEVLALYNKGEHFPKSPGAYADNHPYDPQYVEKVKDKAAEVVSLLPLNPNRDKVGGSGAVGTLFNVAEILEQANSFEEAVTSAIYDYGGDTDTTACVVGGVAGLLFGMTDPKTGIPQRWIKNLRLKEAREFNKKLASNPPPGLLDLDLA